MKNIHDILSGLGITVPEDKKADFDKSVAENYKTVAEFEKKVSRLEAERDSHKERADTAEETLKGFDGKDFGAIIRERDEWQRKHDDLKAAHQKEKDDQEFNDALSAAISGAKGKNDKAIAALLDLEKLRGSKNRDKDIKDALDALRSENGYLFEDNGGAARFDDGGTPGGGNPGTLTKKDIMAIKDPGERQAKIAANINLFQKG